jgi:signal transduction histidine kinase
LKLLRHVGLGGRLLGILAIVVIVDFLVNTALFERTSDFALRTEDAERMAEHLVIAHRVIEAAPSEERNAVAQQLSTERFAITWSRVRLNAIDAIELATLRGQILEFEPELSKSHLHMKLMPLSNGGNIAGSVTLRDGSVINFRTFGRVSWTLNMGRLVAMALPSLVLLILAWILFRAALKPLRTLVRATSEVGAGSPRPVEETGQAEIRHLIRAFNAMQERIHQLLGSGSQTLLAIGHDLRTPLARMQLRIDDAGIKPGLRAELDQDISEMRDLLQSLQTFVESGDEGPPPERIDIAATALTQVDNARDSGALITYRGPRHLEIMVRPVSIRRALSNLVENALAYAGNARIELREESGAVEIVVDDDGPGIPEDRLVEVLRPFIRLDNARARNTAGMGLGLPIVDRVVRAEGGTLHLANKPRGGLRVTIRLPNALT